MGSPDCIPGQRWRSSSLVVAAILCCWTELSESFLLRPSYCRRHTLTPAPPIIHHTLAVRGSALHLAKSGTKKKKPKDNTITVNRLAYRNYEIIESFEAGIALKGTEVKSIRDGKMNLRDGYIKATKTSCTLLNVHIGKHSMAGPYFQHEEKRPRALLVHKNQARKLNQQTDQQGMTIVPLKAYFNDDNRVKLQIALCRGKNVRDKREAIKERDAKREANRIIKSFRL